VTTVGVLALQGGFEAHLHALARAGADAREVRRVAQLADLRALIVPGGESTTLLNLMADEPWFDALRAFHGRFGSLFGTCAGAILLAREVRGPAQPSLGLLDAAAERNAYGRQVDSFETLLDAPALGGLVPGVFIRAPRLRDLGPGVDVLASRDGEPVLVRDGRVWAATFHPELTSDPRVHRAFVDSVARVKAA
jgi:5'-phosphate synthase pdxT subunit